MNQFRKPSPVWRYLGYLPLLAAAALLLRATWLPVFEIRGFGEYDLKSVGMWATQAARFTLVAGILCLPLRSLGVSRWWMALSVGILFGPLASLLGQAIDLTQSPGSEIPVNIKDVIVPHTGAWYCVAGLACWLLDVAAAVGGGIVQAWRGRR